MVTRLSASKKRDEVVMLQIMPSTWVPGLMKLLMRNAICLRLLSPPPIARVPPPRLPFFFLGFSTGSSVWRKWSGEGGGGMSIKMMSF